MTWKGFISLTQNENVPSYLDSDVPVLFEKIPADSNILDARPILSQKAPESTHILYFLINFANDEQKINRAYINHQTSIDSTMNMTTMYDPMHYHRSMSLKDVKSLIPKYQIDPSTRKFAILGDANDPFIVPYNAVVDIFFNNTDTGEHPLHFHGHKFWIIATSDYPEAEYLYVDNYLRRDIVSVPAQGWAKIRFVANNPGVWLLHSCITWHLNAGFSSKVIEAPVELYHGLQSNKIKPSTISQLTAPCSTGNPSEQPSPEPTAVPSK